LSSKMRQYLENGMRFSKVLINHKEEVAYVLSIGTKIDDLG